MPPASVGCTRARGVVRAFERARPSLRATCCTLYALRGAPAEPRPTVSDVARGRGAATGGAAPVT